MLCRISCYVWQLLWKMTSINLNISNPIWAMNCAASLYKQLKQLKLHLLMANVICHNDIMTEIIWWHSVIKYLLLKEISFLYVHFSENRIVLLCIVFVTIFFYFYFFWWLFEHRKFIFQSNRIIISFSWRIKYNFLKFLNETFIHDRSLFKYSINVLANRKKYDVSNSLKMGQEQNLFDEIG